MEPENDGLEDDFPFQLGGLMFHVNLPGCCFYVFTQALPGTSPVCYPRTGVL